MHGAWGAGESSRTWSEASISLGCDRDHGPTDARLTWLARSDFLAPVNLSLFSQFLSGGLQLIQ